MASIISAGEVARTATLQVPGFNAFGGVHCETSALSKVLRHEGRYYSEALLFGLAGGIGFIYWTTKKMPIPFIGGRNGRFPEFLATACRRLRIGFEVLTTSSANKAFQQLKGALAEGHPAIVYGDIAYLPYFGTPRHFGGHAFVVYGINEAEGWVAVSDRGRAPCRVPLDDLARARASVAGPFPPRHAQLRLTIPRESVSLAPIVQEAIAATCLAFRRSPINNLGLPGIQRLAAEVIAWPKRYVGPQLIDVLMDSYVNLELAGTGGGAFRRLYADFLEEAQATLAMTELAAAVKQMRQLADTWRAVATGFLPEAVPGLARCRQLLDARNQLFEEQGDDYDNRIATINAQIAAAKEEAQAGLDHMAADAILQSVRALLLSVHELEEACNATLMALT